MAHTYQSIHHSYPPIHQTEPTCSELFLHHLQHSDPQENVKYYFLTFFLDAIVMSDINIFLCVFSVSTTYCASLC